MMLKLMIIAFLVSISFQRKYYNGWNQWKHNCETCKKFLEIAMNDINQLKDNADEVDKQIVTLTGKINSKCTNKNEGELCKQIFSIGFFIKKVLTIVNVNNIKDSYEICRHDDINFCPPKGRVSMYDTPQFPQLTIDNESRNNFTRMLESMDKFEL